jgi:hypothetical protein
MPDKYERAVDALLDAIRTHLHQQDDRHPTDEAVAAYIRHSDPPAIHHDLHQYPECRTAAQYLAHGRTNTTNVLYVMLWGRVNDWTPHARSINEESADTQHDHTPHSQ